MKPRFNPDDYEPATRAPASTAPATPVARTKRARAPARARPKVAPPIAAPRAASPVAPPPPLSAGPQFVGLPRSLRIPLVYPVTYDGRLISAITLRRPGAADTAAFLERAGEGGSLSFPIFFDDDGVAVPPVVLEFLDPDDDETVFEMVPSFVPRRLQRLLEA